MALAAQVAVPGVLGHADQRVGELVADQRLDPVVEAGHQHPGRRRSVGHRAFRHGERAYGIQFHPESVLTEGGYLMLANWLDVAGLPTARAAAKGLTPLVNLA